ncbi:MAG: EamA family transporter [Actinobacteria bacterium]|nr:EamA family transporter [Actinomycetota bacterium]
MIAIITGLATFGAIISFLYLIKIGKFGLSWMLVNLSFSVPTLISIFVFGERPTISIYLALLLALVTLLLLFEIRRNEFRIKNIRTWTFLVLASMMLSGIADSGPKVIKEIAPGYAAMTFLSFNYLFALIPSIGFCIKRKEFPTRKEWLVGIGIGLSSLFSFLFLFLSLKTIPGTVVFPLSLTAVNVIVLLLSFIIWKERLNLKQVAGVFTAIIAAVLFNLNF